MRRRTAVKAMGAGLLAALARLPSRASSAEASTDVGVADPPAPVREVGVSTRDAFDSALRDARPGDHVVLADGTYDGSFTLSADGAEGAPIVIRARNLHGAVLTGRLKLAGQHGWAHALKLTGDGASVRDAPLRIQGDGATVTRSWFAGRLGIILTDQQHYRIGYNKFTGTSTPRGRSDHIFIDIPRGADARLPEHGRIYRNLFLDRDESDSESHTIYVGPVGGRAETPSLTDLVIEYNYIDTGRRRSIYTKRAGTIRYNHVIMTRGVFGIRHGTGGKLHGNRVTGCRDAIINGTKHDIRGNDIQARARLQLMAESRNAGDNRFNAADEAVLVGNRADLIVGQVPARGRLERPVRGVRIHDHVGDIELGAEEDTVLDELASLWCPEPVELTPEDVGPEA